MPLSGEEDVFVPCVKCLKPPDGAFSPKSVPSWYRAYTIAVATVHASDCSFVFGVVHCLRWVALFSPFTGGETEGEDTKS